MVKYSPNEVFVTSDYKVPLRSTAKLRNLTEDGTPLVYSEEKLQKTHNEYLKFSEKLSALPFGLYLSPDSSSPRRSAEIRVRALDTVQERVNEISSRTQTYLGNCRTMFANFHLQKAVITEIPHGSFSPLGIALKLTFPEINTFSVNYYSPKEIIKVLVKLKELLSQELQELELPVNDRNLEYLFVLRLAASYGWLTPGYSRHDNGEEAIETIIHKLSKEHNEGNAKQDSYLPLRLAPWIRSEASVEVALTALHPGIVQASKNPLDPKDIEGANDLFSLPFDWWYQVLVS